MDSEKFLLDYEQNQTEKSIAVTSIERSSEQENQDDSASSKENKQGQGELLQMLVQQLETANVIVANKIDLLTLPQLSRLQAILRSLNPKAVIIPTAFSQVPLDAILDTSE